MGDNEIHSDSGENRLGTTAVLVHLGLVVCGIAALLTGLQAGDYKRVEHLGFTVHSWVGMAGAFFVLLRAALGIAGPTELRFGTWVPWTRERLCRVKEDISGLLRFSLPHRPPHEGAAGLVETFGLLAFLATALSGVFLFFTIEPGQKSRGLVHAVKEFHETGLTLILVFLSMHAGAVVLHALTGRHLWRRMVFLKEREAPLSPEGTRVDAAAE
jgi:cytochrome b